MKNKSVRGNQEREVTELEESLRTRAYYRSTIKLGRRLEVADSVTFWFGGRHMEMVGRRKVVEMLGLFRMQAWF